MANADIATGLWPVRKTSGQYWTGAANIYNIPSSYGSNLFLGDPMIPTGTSDANGIPNVTIATAGTSNYLIGTFVGIVNGGEPIVSVTRDLPIYHQASTQQYILVADDPELMFRVQEDGLGGAAGVTASSANANLIAGSGSTVTGMSGWMLDSSTVNTTATLQVRILRPVQAPDNDATLTLAKWLVRINLHSLTNTTGI